MPACPACGFESPPGQRLCGACGSPVPEREATPPAAPATPTKECPACQRPVASTAKFCKYCGTSLAVATTAAADAPVGQAAGQPEPTSAPTSEVASPRAPDFETVHGAGQSTRTQDAEPSVSQEETASSGQEAAFGDSWTADAPEATPAAAGFAAGPTAHFVEDETHTSESRTDATESGPVFAGIGDTPGNSGSRRLWIAAGVGAAAVLVIALGWFLTREPEPQPGRAPQLLAYSPDLVFFDPLTREPRVWYYESADGQYELFDAPGGHPRYGEDLRPITAEIVRELEQPPVGSMSFDVTAWLLTRYRSALLWVQFLPAWGTSKSSKEPCFLSFLIAGPGHILIGR